MTLAALLLIALLFGGMVLYSFGFAAFLFNTLPAETAGPTIRKAFPHFYLFVIATSGFAGFLLLPSDAVAGVIALTIAVTTVPTRQLLMPAINAATDASEKRRFALLHGGSVVITLIHIVAAGYILSRFLT